MPGFSGSMPAASNSFRLYMIITGFDFQGTW